MAALIIVIKTPELEYIDLTKGLYLFGISNVNETIINNSTYQLSNKFDNLQPGLYHWAVKNNNTNIIKAKGIDIVQPDTSNCYTKFVNDSNNIIILANEHKLSRINDIECYYISNNEYYKFIPDEVIISPDRTVTVITNTNFTGKVSVC